MSLNYQMYSQAGSSHPASGQYHASHPHSHPSSSQHLMQHMAPPQLPPLQLPSQQAPSQPSPQQPLSASGSGVQPQPLPQQVAGGSQSTQSATHAFEFTKRKRWADLLVNELSEALILILSHSRKIMFCGNAVTELLGWRDEDLIDKDFLVFVNENDHATFQEGLQLSQRTRGEFTSYVRLKSRQYAHLQHRNAHLTAAEYQPAAVTEIMYEFKGVPHYANPDAPFPNLYFACAKPYPSRNTSLLNTFLDIKIENIRLHRRRDELLAQAAHSGHNGYMHPAGGNVGPGANGLYAASGTSSGAMPPPRVIPSQSPVGMYFPAHVGVGGYDDMSFARRDGSGARRTGYDLSVRRRSVDSGLAGASGYSHMQSSGGAFASGSGGGVEEEPVPTEGGRRKKPKTAEQYVCVTCGRTDSPEWRKGPMGPKTLCNACGLRWAKQMRKAEEESGGEVTKLPPVPPPH